MRRQKGHRPLTGQDLLRDPVAGDNLKVFGHDEMTNSGDSIIDTHGNRVGFVFGRACMPFGSERVRI